MNDSRSEQDDDLDLLWGAGSIGDYIKRNRRQTYYLLETGKIPAKKIGDVWSASKQALKRSLVGETA